MIGGSDMDTTMKQIIPRQKTEKDVYAYIIGYYKSEGYMPTLREIANYLGRMRDRKYSTEWIRLVLRGLEQKGLIKVEKTKLRGITLIKK